jgi:hypothetical protein
MNKDAGKKVASKNNTFLKLNHEKEKFNQYWFSEKSINFIVNQIEKYGGTIALISCPSIFFTLNNDVKEKSFLFDIDTSFCKKHKNAIEYDYRDYDKLIPEYENKFDFILIDPPFIDKEPWSKFAEFAIRISKKDDEGKPNVKFLCSSIAENKEMLKNLINVDIKLFQPSIPNLIYQYNFYSNYEDEELNKLNNEIIA